MNGTRSAPDPAEDACPGRQRYRAADDTRARIIAAAARHIGRHGPQGASLRSLLADAGASTSAANYHFGSKSGLYRAVAESYHERIRDRLETLIAAAEQQPAGIRRIRALVDAHIRSHLELVVTEDGEDYGLMALQFSAGAESDEWRSAEQVVQSIRQRFHDALKALCPDIDDGRLGRGIGLVVSVMARAPFNGPDFTITASVLRREPLETIIDEAVSFATGGLMSLLGIGEIPATAAASTAA